MGLRRIAKQFLPPIIVDMGKSLLENRVTAGSPEWEYIPEGWSYLETHREVKGWNVGDILEVYKEKWPRYISMAQGTGPLGIATDCVLPTDSDTISHNIYMSFAYALALATRHRDSLTMLDWGGGIGHYYLLARSLLPGVQIQYHCKDVPILAEYGGQLFPEQHFYTDESCLERTYDFVMASVSIHYTEDWRRLLVGLARATHGYLYITGLPTVLRAPSFVFVQRPYAYGYNTEYLGWCLNRKEFLACAEAAGMRLIREFIVGHRPSIHRAPEQNVYRGFLFIPASIGNQ